MTLTRRGLLRTSAVGAAAALLTTDLWTEAAFAATARTAYIDSNSPYSAIRALQFGLNAYGIATGTDGSYGPGTTASVKTFQSRRGLSTDGSAGPATTKAMFGGSNMAASYNWPNASTTQAVQQLLCMSGYTVPIDGSFGPATQAKVKDFQSHFSLGSTGVVDWVTWSYLIMPPSASGSSGKRTGPIVLVSQSGTGLASWESDCGPTSFVMLELRLGKTPGSWSDLAHRGNAISYARHTVLGMNNNSLGTSQIGVGGIVSGFKRVGITASHGGVSNGCAAVRAGGVAMQQGRLDVAYSWQGVSKSYRDHYHWVALLDYRSSDGKYLIGDPSSTANKLVWVTQAALTTYGGSYPDSVYVS